MYIHIYEVFNGRFFRDGRPVMEQVTAVCTRAFLGGGSPRMPVLPREFRERYPTAEDYSRNAQDLVRGSWRRSWRNADPGGLYRNRSQYRNNNTKNWGILYQAALASIPQASWDLLHTGLTFSCFMFSCNFFIFIFFLVILFKHLFVYP